MDYKVALIILYDTEKRFLLQHRSLQARLLPGYWAFFGGGVRQGESLSQALKREAQEELNYKVNHPQLLHEQDFREDRVRGRLYVYAELFLQDKTTLKLREGQNWGWFKESETRTLKMVGRDRRILKHLSHYLKNKEAVSALR